MSFKFKVGQKVKFLHREYDNSEPSEDFYLKKRVQGSGKILELSYTKPESEGGSQCSMTIQLSPGHNIELPIAGGSDKVTYIQPLD